MRKLQNGFLDVGARQFKSIICVKRAGHVPQFGDLAVALNGPSEQAIKPDGAMSLVTRYPAGGSEGRFLDASGLVRAPGRGERDVGLGGEVLAR